MANFWILKVSKTQDMDLGQNFEFSANFKASVKTQVNRVLKSSYRSKIYFRDL